MNFRSRLRQLRKEIDKTQRELAQDLHIPPSTYSDYERGRTKPDIDTLTRMAGFLGVTTDFLLGLSDIRKHSPDLSDEKIKKIMEILEK